jgi:hypothetical protein
MSSAARFIAVVHMVPDAGPTDEALLAHYEAQALLARECGADGVALVPHGLAGASASGLVTAAARRIKGAWADCFLVANFMAPPAEAMASVPAEVDVLWTDKGVGPADGSGGRIGPGSGATALAAQLRAVRQRDRPDWRGLWLAGLFHKGDGACEGPLEQTDEELAQRAHELRVDLGADGAVTTGAATGLPALPANVRRLREALGPGIPLALASGVTPENVGDYVPFVDLLIVGTGIERAEPAHLEFYLSAGYDAASAARAAVRAGDLDPQRVRALAQAMKQARNLHNIACPDPLQVHPDSHSQLRPNVFNIISHNLLKLLQKAFQNQKEKKNFL